VGVANMDGSKNSYENQAQAYKQKLTKYESVIKEKEVWARSKMRFKN
jgi:hypothetical protein